MHPGDGQWLLPSAPRMGLERGVGSGGVRGARSVFQKGPPSSGAGEEGNAFSEEWLSPGPGRICLAEPQLLFAARPGREADSD